jgi:hypothetical protein
MISSINIKNLDKQALSEITQEYNRLQRKEISNMTATPVFLNGTYED